MYFITNIGQQGPSTRQRLAVQKGNCTRRKNAHRFFADGQSAWPGVADPGRHGARSFSKGGGGNQPVKAAVELSRPPSFICFAVNIKQSGGVKDEITIKSPGQREVGGTLVISPKINQGVFR